MLLRRHNQRTNAVKAKAISNNIHIEAQQVETPVEPISYTKTEINRMSKDDLVALATENGIENAAEISGADLKTMLIEKLV